MTTRPALPLLVLTAVAFAAVACSPSSPSPSAPAPTPTPIAAEVETPEDAATLVIASNPLFAGSTQLTPDMIGANNYWEAEALPGGGFRITQTIGWGDCPAGCINNHVWVYEVSADGQVELIEESGDPVPADGIPNN